MNIPDNKSLITVLMPVYNAAPYLSEAINSVLEQTYTEFEFIIINDGSTDNSEEIIFGYMDQRIVYIKHEKNKGLIQSLNSGIEVARGSFIARMDADDIALPQRFELQMNVLKKHPGAIVVSCDYFAMSGNKLKPVHNFNRSDELRAVLLFAPCFAHPTVMMRNVFAEKKLMYDPDFLHAEDYRLWTELSGLGEFYNVNKPLLRYRSHPGQVSALNSEIQKEKSDLIRRSYLTKLGFIFNEDQLLVHNKIGNNVFIRSRKDLEAIERWLLELLEQNKRIGMFEKDQFAAVINKFWYDSCGFTSLGMKAYRLYFYSEISTGFRNDLSKKTRLLTKCLLRKFK